MTKNKFKSFWVLVAIFSWVLLVIGGYYIFHKPVSMDQINNLGNAIIDVFSVFALIGLAGGIGRRILPAAIFSPLERMAIQATLGLGLLSLFWLGIGLLGLFYPWVGWACLLTGWGFFHRHGLVWFGEIRVIVQYWFAVRRLERILAVACGILLAWQLFFALAPPIKWDALTYHLAMPSRYLQAGRFEFLADNPFWGNPQITEMLYTWAIALRGLETAGLMGWVIGVCFLLGMLGSVSRIINPGAGWIAITALLAGYTFRGMFSWGYVDLLAALFGLSVLIFCLKLVESEDRSAYLWIGILAGFALGVKLTAAMLIPITWIALFMGKSKEGLWKKLVISFILALIIYSPWLVKNLIFTGMPLYPFLGTTSTVTSERLAYFYEPGRWEISPLLYFVLPVAMTWFGLEGASVEGVPNFFADIGPLLLLLAIPGLCLIKRERQARLVFMWLIVGWLFMVGGSQLSSLWLQTRLYFVLISAAAMASAWGWEVLQKFSFAGVRLRRVLGVIICLVVTINLWQDARFILRYNPTAYLLGETNRDTYLNQALGWYYPVMGSLAALPATTRTLFLWEPRSLYTPNNVVPDVLIDRWFLERQSQKTTDETIQSWREAGFSHLLYYRSGAEFERQHRRELTAEDWTVLDELLSNLRLDTDIGGVYQLYTLAP